MEPNQTGIDLASKHGGFPAPYLGRSIRTFSRSANRTIRVSHAWNPDQSTLDRPAPNGSDGWTQIGQVAAYAILRKLEAVPAPEAGGEPEMAGRSAAPRGSHRGWSPATDRRLSLNIQGHGGSVLPKGLLCPAMPPSAKTIGVPDSSASTWARLAASLYIRPLRIS